MSAMAGNTPAGFTEVTPPFNGGIQGNVTTDATTARALTMSDGIANYIRMTNAVGSTVTVQPESAVPFPIGTRITIRKAGLGNVTVVAGSGVTINASSLTLDENFETLTMIKVAADEWDVFEDAGTADSAEGLTRGQAIDIPNLSTFL